MFRSLFFPLHLLAIAFGLAVLAFLGVVALAAVLSLVSAFKKPAKPMAGTQSFTQCIASVATPDARLAGYHRDAGRACIGIRWSVPGAYLEQDQGFRASKPYDTALRGTGIDEAVHLQIPIDHLLPAPEAAQHKPYAVTIQATTLAGRASSFQQWLDLVLRLRGRNFRKTGDTRLGMPVHADLQPTIDRGDFWLVPEHNPQMYLVCPVFSRSAQLHYFDTSPVGSCRVVTHHQARLLIEYRLPFAHLKDHDIIHAAVLARVKGFVVD